MNGADPRLRIPRDMLGPLGSMVDNREHLKAAGPVTVSAPGRAEWRVDRSPWAASPFPAMSYLDCSRKPPARATQHFQW